MGGSLPDLRDVSSRSNMLPLFPEREIDIDKEPEASITELLSESDFHQVLC